MVGAMLCLTSILVVLCMNMKPEITKMMATGAAIDAVFTIFLLICASIPCNGPKSRRKLCHKLFPFNYILLLNFTLATSVLLCFLVLKTDNFAVVQATSLTFAMVVGLATFAWTKKSKENDATQMAIATTDVGQYVFVLGFMFAAVGILMMVCKDQLTTSM